MAHKFLLQAGVDRPPLLVEVEPLGEERFRVVIDGQEEVIQARPVSHNSYGVTTWSLLGERGVQHQVDVDGTLPALRVGLPSGDTLSLTLEDARTATLAAEARRPVTAGPQQVRAPMPGKVVKVLCKIGDRVQAGQGLLLIEAMKMENELRAPADGVVRELRVAEGQSVEGGAVLVAIA